jgi:hypothetical protein
VKRHGFWDENYGVPVFWRVENGTYGDPDTWKGLHIPKQWLLNTEHNNPKILLLEADSVGKDSVASIFSPGMANNSDLDLYEVTQGFYRLTRLVEDDAPPHQVLRVYESCWWMRNPKSQMGEAASVPFETMSRAWD